MKIVWEDPSLGREATAEDKFANCPEVVVLRLTTTEPSGGVVLQAAHAEEIRDARYGTAMVLIDEDSPASAPASS